MADSCPKKPKITPPRAPRIRYSIQIEVEPGMEGRLERLKSRIQHAKSALAMTVRTPLGNLLMMERLLSAFDECERSRFVSTSSCSHQFMSTLQPPSSYPLLPEPSPSCSKQCTVETQTDIADPYILARGENTTGRYDIHTPSKQEENYFVSSINAVRELVAAMAHYGGRCPLCGFPLELSSFSVMKHSHVVRTSVNCAAGHAFRWNSSSSIGGKFTANLR